MIRTLLKENSFKKLAISFVFGFSRTGFSIATSLFCRTSSEKIDQKSEVEERNHTDKRAREEPEQEL